MDDRNETEEQFFEAFAGDDLAIPVQLIDGNGAPMKIATGDGMSDIVGEFLNNDGTVFQTKYSASSGVTLVDASCGRALVNVPASASASLQTSKAKKQPFAVYLIKNSLKTTWAFKILLKPRPVSS